MNEDRRAERALQMILEACALQRYVAPYELVLSDARGTRIAARFDHDGAEPLAGDFGSIGLLVPPLSVFVTDALGESAEFSVALWKAEDGRRMGGGWPRLSRTRTRGLNQRPVACNNPRIWMCTPEFPTIAALVGLGCCDR